MEKQFGYKGDGFYKKGDGLIDVDSVKADPVGYKGDSLIDVGLRDTWIPIAKQPGNDI